MHTQDTQALQPSEIELLKEKIKDIRTAMLTTQEPDGDFHSRPMATQAIDPDGTMWFFTYDDTNKVREITANNRVSLTFTDTGSETYVATSGTAEVVKDQRKIDELWSEVLKTWFPKGKDDPHLMLIKVHPQAGEFWDHPGGKMTALFQMVRGALTGKPDRLARNEKFGDEPAERLDPNQ